MSANSELFMDQLVLASCFGDTESKWILLKDASMTSAGHTMWVKGLVCLGLPIMEASLYTEGAVSFCFWITSYQMLSCGITTSSSQWDGSSLVTFYTSTVNSPLKWGHPCIQATSKCPKVCFQMLVHAISIVHAILSSQSSSFLSRWSNLHFWVANLLNRW